MIITPRAWVLINCCIRLFSFQFIFFLRYISFYLFEHLRYMINYYYHFHSHQKKSNGWLFGMLFQFWGTNESCVIKKSYIWSTNEYCVLKKLSIIISKNGFFGNCIILGYSYITVFLNFEFKTIWTYLLKNLNRKCIANMTF